MVLRGSLSLGDKGDNGRHQTNSSRLVGFGFVLVCPLAWTSTRLTQTVATWWLRARTVAAMSAALCRV